MIVRKYSCCMCPQTDEQREARICPPNNMTGRGEVPCEFVLMFMDDAGKKYLVGFDKKCGKYVVKYQKGLGGDKRWFMASCFSKHEYFHQAQQELNEYAVKNDWQAVLPNGRCEFISDYIA